jgi:hypothetical protein
MTKSLNLFSANSSLNQNYRSRLMNRRIVLESIFVSRAKGLDQLPFLADFTLPSVVFGPVDFSQGRQRWIATA